MNQMLERRPSPAMAVAFTALLVALGGVAFATIPDSNGEIHGCFKKANGDLRVVSSAGDCRNNERPIAWNQEGPPGSGGGAVVARPRGTTSQTATNSFADYPLVDQTWTQQAGETDLIFAQITATPPADCSGPNIAAVQAQISVDGQFVAFAAQIGSGASNIGSGVLFEPGSATGRTATVRIKDDCTTGQHFTVNSVKIVVLGFE
jgi:hypothetical protein